MEQYLVFFKTLSISVKIFHKHHDDYIDINLFKILLKAFFHYILEMDYKNNL